MLCPVRLDRDAVAAMDFALTGGSPGGIIGRYIVAN
jgi:hypothetical protein